MTRAGTVYCNGIPAGRLEETASGYRFTYSTDYLIRPGAQAVSLTLPLQRAAFEAAALFPFFFGLLAEGTLKAAQCRQLRLDEDDHFGRLLMTAHNDTIGNVTIVEDTAS
jgi:HipA-like protein